MMSRTASAESRPIVVTPRQYTPPSGSATYS
jgi:hypothetical protein